MLRSATARSKGPEAWPVQVKALSGQPDTYLMRGRWILFAIGCAIVLVAGCTDASDEARQMLDTGAAPTASTRPSTVIVPNVMGLDQPTARRLLREAGFDADFSRHTTTRYPVRTVFWQSLAPGESVPVGMSITLRVVLNPFRIVPDMVGQNARAARLTLQDQLYTVRIVRKPSSQPSGTVISQVPDGGTQVRTGHRVTLVVAE